MATLLYRLGRWCATHGWRVIAMWLAALGLLGGLAVAFGTPSTSVVQIPDAKFADVMQRLESRLPDVTGTVGTAVFVTEDGKAFTPAQEEAIAEVVATWESDENVTSVIDPFETQATIDQGREDYAAGQKKLRKGQQQLLDGGIELEGGRKMLALGEEALADAERTAPDSPQTAALRRQVEDGRQQLAEGQREVEKGQVEIKDARVRLWRAGITLDASSGVRFVSQDGTTAISQIGFAIDPQSMPLEDRERVVEAADSLDEVGVNAYFGNEITQETSVVGAGEIVGLATAALVLVLMLGSLVAAGLPLIVALFGVGVGLAAAMATTYFFEMHQMTPALALMLGLAVGIDYSLFIVNRHREQVRHGMPLAESIGRAVGTSGNAVVFAGATVVVALVALVLSGLPILGQMGLVAAGAVAAAVLMAITLAPALLGLIGHRVLPRRAWRKVGGTGSSSAQDEVHGGWYVTMVTARPWVTIVLVVGLLGLVAWPLTQLRLGLPDGSSEEPGSSAHTAYTTVADKFGPGMNGSLLVLADLPEGSTAEDADATGSLLTQDLMAYDGVASVVPVGRSDDNATMAWQVVLDSGPNDEATTDSVHAMLDTLPEVGERTGAEIGITGRTVANIEISEKLSAALVPYLSVVVGLSLLILMAVFRSVVVPLIATGGFLLSVGAAFGALVAVFQWGWLGDLFGVHTPGPLMSFGPILLIGVLFGLAMDYQMFLVSGMREAYAHGKDSRKAIAWGFTHGAKVVTAAAAIMFAVFGGFVFSHMVMVRPIGFGLAVGVLVDAVLVRMTLTPAVMHLLGDKAWWMPKWLDRLLPDFDVEGTRLAERLAAEQETRPARERELVDA